MIGLVANYFFAERYLLRLDWPSDPFASISKHLVAVREPVALIAGGRGKDEPVLRGFTAAVGLTSPMRPALANTLIPIQQVTRGNPYPQPFAVVNGRDVDYVSYGYVGADGRYHQVTHYWGESDATPSILVKKVRGPQTGWGDYFVRYTVYLSRDLKSKPRTVSAEAGEVTSWEPPPTSVDVDRVDWSTYEGGSYDGFEELGFAVIATPLEGMVVSCVWAVWRSRRPFRNKLQPATGEGAST
jgi:hypothetical protein